MKRILATILALMLLLSLVACSSTPAETPSEPTTTPSTSDTPATTPDEPADEPVNEPAETPADEPADEPAETPADEPAADTGIDPATNLDPTTGLSYGYTQIPIVEEPKTFTAWALNAVYSDVGLDDPNEAPGIMAVEELTNIHVDWTGVSGAAGFEAFNLMVASGDYDDFIHTISFMLAGGLSSYIENEVLIDLAPYMDEYAPNYQALRMADESVRRDTMTDNGEIAGLFRIQYPTKQSAYSGLVVRQDYLNDIGAEVPVTLDEYHDLLVRFRDELNIERPTTLGTNGLDDSYLSTFGITGANSMDPQFIVKDGKVTYSFTSPEFKDYLTTMNQWYQEGLIYHDFYTTEAEDNMQADVLAGSYGLFSAHYNTFALYAELADDPDFEMQPIAAPLLNAGDTRVVKPATASMTRYEGWINGISTSCEDPETLLQYLDFFFSEAGMYACVYGILGESYNFDENRQPVYTELMTNNPEGWTYQTALKYYTNSEMSCLYDWQAQQQSLPESAKNAGKTWEAGWVDERTMPSTLTLTVEETEAHGATFNDIQTYVSENIVRFITGEKPLSEYEAYVATIEGMGLAQATAAQQGAYDRYMAR